MMATVRETRTRPVRHVTERGSPRRQALWCVVTLLVLWAVPVSQLKAQGPPIFTDTAIMLGLQGRGIRTFSQWTWSQNGVQQNIPLTSKTRGRIWSQPFVLPYNLFSDRFQVVFLVPVVQVHQKVGAVERNHTGVGDIRVLLKHMVWKKDSRQQTVRVAVKAGLEFPTGSRDAPALGSGTTDWLAGVVVTGIRRRVGLYGETLFQRNGTRDGLDRGDVWHLKAALAYRLLPAVYRRYPAKTWNGYLELLYQHLGSNRLQGHSEPDSGGWMLVLAPGLQFIGGRRWLLEAGVQLPMVRRFPEPVPRLRWSLRIGTRALLF